MAPMSNADRQREFRKRLKKRASLDALGEQATKAADLALEALWAFYSRPAPGGGQWGDMERFVDIAAFKASCVDDGDLREWCENALCEWRECGATEDEAKAWQTVVDATDALLARPKPKPKGRRR